MPSALPLPNFLNIRKTFLHSRPVSTAVLLAAALLLFPPAALSFDPDDSETDDGRDTARLIITGSSATATEHTFHDEGDEDWVKFYGYSDDYTVYITHAGSRCSAVIEVYEGDGTTLREGPFFAEEPGDDVTAEFSLSEDDACYLRIRNSNPGVYGEETQYRLLVRGDTTSGKPVGVGTVTGSVSDAQNGGLLNSVIIRTDGGVGTLPDRGVYLMLHQAGRFSLSAFAEGYLPFSTEFEIEAGTTLTLPIVLVPQQPIPPGESCLVEVLLGEESDDVRLLKRYRDVVLQASPAGRTLMKSYYALSPVLAGLCRHNRAARFLLSEVIGRFAHTLCPEQRSAGTPP